MSNILFALYNDFFANSAIQVHNFANELARLGHGVSVAIPTDGNRGALLGEQRYSVNTYSEVDGNWTRLFNNRRPPDVLHAWTPRENVRLFCEKLRRFCSAALIVHLEDNEERILEANLGVPFESLCHSSPGDLPKDLSHPSNYRAFIASASGVTMIIDQLAKFVPASLPQLIVWPGADPELFFPRAKDAEFAARIGVAPDDIVLCYTGNVHAANAREVRSLYVAAAILDREGIPTTLVRAGRDYCRFLGPDEQWADKISVNLGDVKHVKVPVVLSLADFLIQPGADDEFNAYRLPAKLPEFFAMGKPVILPRTNAGSFVQHGENAWVLPKVDALGIVEAVQKLRLNDALLQRLSAGAVAFWEEHFSWRKNTAKLAQFYDIILGRKKWHATAVPIS